MLFSRKKRYPWKQVSGAQASRKEDYAVKVRSSVKPTEVMERADGDKHKQRQG